MSKRNVIFLCGHHVHSINRDYKAFEVSGDELPPDSAEYAVKVGAASYDVAGIKKQQAATAAAEKAAAPKDGGGKGGDRK